MNLDNMYDAARVAFEQHYADIPLTLSKTELGSYRDPAVHSLFISWTSAWFGGATAVLQGVH